MKQIPFFSLLTAFAVSTFTFAQNSFIPQPQQLELKKGTFVLGNKITINPDPNFPEIDYLMKQFKSITGKNLTKTTSNNFDNTINIIYLAGPENLSEEYYELDINQNGISIAAPTNRGIFLGIQTLLQLIEEHKKDFKLPYLKIKDEPKFAYRGMHLDVCRHFFTVEEVKNYLDYLAAYKYNKFHWHLTDD